MLATSLKTQQHSLLSALLSVTFPVACFSMRANVHVCAQTKEGGVHGLNINRQDLADATSTNEMQSAGQGGGL